MIVYTMKVSEPELVEGPCPSKDVPVSETHRRGRALKRGFWIRPVAVNVDSEADTRIIRK